jgi:hypothetical protein
MAKSRRMASHDSRPTVRGKSVIRVIRSLICTRKDPEEAGPAQTMLDELSAGRVRLGIGSGIPQRIARLSMRYRPLAALTDAVQSSAGCCGTRP